MWLTWVIRVKFRVTSVHDLSFVWEIVRSLTTIWSAPNHVLREPLCLSFFAARTRTLPARVLTLVALVAVLISSITIVSTATPATASALVSLNKSAPERTLVGGDIEYPLAATSTHSDLLFNLSFKDVLPVCVAVSVLR